MHLYIQIGGFMRLTRTSLALVITLAAAAAGAQTIDHTDLAGVASLPQSVMNRVGQQRWVFTHASVGGNMIDGMDALHAANATRYKLVPTWTGFDWGSNRLEPPPATTTPGAVYECNRGNPGWSEKLTIFDDSVRLSGWHFSSVDVAMDKLCYIDEAASATDYLNMMASLEAAYLTTRFVYITMPLTTSTGSDNVQRNQYNQAVRAYCRAHSKLLFDLADIEAHDPNGVQQTFVYGGQTYQRLYANYTSDGGHLNTLGQERAALGWYATAAVIADQVFSDGFDRGF